MKKVYIIIGSISLALGTLGIFMPLLPTVPFFLLTAWFYMRGSDKLYGKVMNNKYFGTIVRNFQENKGISLKTKVVVVSMLWASILLSAFLAISVWWLRLLLFAVAVGVTIHVLSYRTKKKILSKEAINCSPISVVLNAKKILSFLLVALFLSYYAGSTLFPHTHKYAWGTVTHSHPYSSATHTHTANALYFINNLNNLLFFFGVSIFCFGLFIVSKALFSSVNTRHATTLLKGCIQLRAPPVLA